MPRFTGKMVTFWVPARQKIHFTNKLCQFCILMFYSILIINRTQLEKKEQEYQNKGLITGPAAQKKIAAGDTNGAVAYLENELAQSQVQ